MNKPHQYRKGATVGIPEHGPVKRIRTWSCKRCNAIKTRVSTKGAEGQSWKTVERTVTIESCV